MIPLSSPKHPCVSLISPIMVYVFPLPVCKNQPQLEQQKHQYTTTYSQEQDKKSFTVIYLTISKHTTVVTRQTILHHGHSGNSEKIFLHQFTTKIRICFNLNLSFNMPISRTEISLFHISNFKIELTKP